MLKTVSLNDLLGLVEKPEKTDAAEPRVAVSHLWLADFKGAPEWFLKKYFRNANGLPCGRMYVKLYDKLGKQMSSHGQPLFKRNGKPKLLNTYELARIVEADLAKAGYPDMKVHFRGYDLDPIHYVLTDIFLQEEYEENERRHVPGLDEDEIVFWNREAALDRETWLWCASNMLRALQMRQLMVLNLDEDFCRVMAASDFVPASFNNELLEIKHRMQDTMTNEVALFLMNRGWDDFREFAKDDVVKTYRRCMRCMTGIEAGEPMFDQAYLLGKEPVEGFDWKNLYEMMGKGYITANPFPDLPEANAFMEVLANEMEIDVIDWEYDPNTPENLYDDDSGEAMTNILLAH